MKLETKLSREWIADLRKTIQQPLVVRKIHGHPAQETMVDYLLWYNGKGIVIEFKTLTDGSKFREKQEEFLKKVSRTNNPALSVIFIDEKKWEQFISYKMWEGVFVQLKAYTPRDVIVLVSR